MTDDPIIIAHRVLPSGMVEVTASIAPAKHIRVIVPRRRSTLEDMQEAVRAAVASGRFESLPPQPP